MIHFDHCGEQRGTKIKTSLHFEIASFIELIVSTIIISNVWTSFLSEFICLVVRRQCQLDIWRWTFEWYALSFLMYICTLKLKRLFNTCFVATQDCCYTIIKPQNLNMATTHLWTWTRCVARVRVCVKFNDFDHWSINTTNTRLKFRWNFIIEHINRSINFSLNEMSCKQCKKKHAPEKINSKMTF